MTGETTDGCRQSWKIRMNIFRVSFHRLEMQRGKNNIVLVLDFFIPEESQRIMLLFLCSSPSKWFLYQISIAGGITVSRQYTNMILLCSKVNTLLVLNIQFCYIQ